jgi:hypothetical protein
MYANVMKGVFFHRPSINMCFMNNSTRDEDNVSVNIDDFDESMDDDFDTKPLLKRRSSSEHSQEY